MLHKSEIKRILNTLAECCFEKFECYDRLRWFISQEFEAGNLQIDGVNDETIFDLLDAADNF